MEQRCSDQRGSLLLPNTAKCSLQKKAQAVICLNDSTSGHIFDLQNSTAGLSRSTRSPPTVSARTHLIGPHAYNFSTNQSDAYTFSTGQSQVYKNSTSQSQAWRFSTVGFCWWPVVVTAPTDTVCTQATRRVWAGNPAFKTKQEKKSL